MRMKKYNDGDRSDPTGRRRREHIDKRLTPSAIRNGRTWNKCHRSRSLLRITQSGVYAFRFGRVTEYEVRLLVNWISQSVRAVLRRDRGGATTAAAVPALMQNGFMTLSDLIHAKRVEFIETEVARLITEGKKGVETAG